MRLSLPWSLTDVCTSTPRPTLAVIALATTRVCAPPVRLTPTKREPLMSLCSTRLFEDSTRPMPVKLPVMCMLRTTLRLASASRTP
jgi:hypothetical protein